MKPRKKKPIPTPLERRARFDATLRVGAHGKTRSVELLPCPGAEKRGEQAPTASVRIRLFGDDYESGIRYGTPQGFYGVLELSANEAIVFAKMLHETGTRALEMARDLEKEKLQ